jgi:hypothetical protein
LFSASFSTSFDGSGFLALYATFAFYGWIGVLTSFDLLMAFSGGLFLFCTYFPSR